MPEVTPPINPMKGKYVVDNPNEKHHTVNQPKRSIVKPNPLITIMVLACQVLFLSLLIALLVKGITWALSL